MGEKRIIKAKTLVADIRAGLTESELLAKYDISAIELRHVVSSLRSKGHIRAREIAEWHASADESPGKSGTRELPRAYLRIPPEISDCQDALNRGLVTDISVGGFRTRGLTAGVGDRKAFLIHACDIADTVAVQVKATCKWCKGEAAEANLREAGFSIDEVSESGVIEIQKLIQLLSIGDRNRRRG